MSRLAVLAVVPEIFPLVKTGGLADVAGALPLALVAEGIATTSLVPGYPEVMDALEQAETVYRFDDLFGGPARLLRGTAVGLDLIAIDAPHLYQRPGNPYLGPDRREWPDNALRFAALGAAAAVAGTGAVAGLEVDVVHAHDWQAGLAPVYLHYHAGPRPGTVITIHNLAFQGWFPLSVLPVLGLPDHAWHVDRAEYFGGIGFLKAGLALADRITTVSPTYASEIRTETDGMALDGLLRARAADLTGILNGIDDTVWDPATDPLIPSRFSAATVERRAANKAALQTRMGLALDPEALLIGIISRLSEQKGLDLVLEVLHGPQPFQLALLGSGSPEMEARFRAAAASYPGKVGCVIGYDESLSHLMQAGSDALLVPSRFEPCGLTQMCALRYGNVPVVSRVGGLADTVIDANEMALAAGVATGVQFFPVTREALVTALGRTVALWQDKTAWQRLQRNAMQADVSWRRSAARYAALYRSLVRQRTQ